MREVHLATVMAMRNRFSKDIWTYQRWSFTCGRRAAPIDPLPKASRDWYTYRLQQQRAEAIAWLLHHGNPNTFGAHPVSVRVALWQQFFKRGHE